MHFFPNIGYVATFIAERFESDFLMRRTILSGPRFLNESSVFPVFGFPAELARLSQKIFSADKR